MPLHRLLWIVLLCVTFEARTLGSQAQEPPVLPPFGAKPAEEKERAKMEKEMTRKANQQRQADLKRDTEKLFNLATELKNSVEKTNTGILSVEVVKKAEEIEKLAHSVKEKMKNSY